MGRALVRHDEFRSDPARCIPSRPMVLHVKYLSKIDTCVVSVVFVDSSTKAIEGDIPPDGYLERDIPSPNPSRTGVYIPSILTDSAKLQKWKGTIRREERLLDRQISSLKEQEDKTRRMIQQMAKKRPQDVGNARILAKELVRARKQRQRMYQSKATLNSIQMQLQEQIGRPILWKSLLIEATYKISGILKQSTGVMRDVNQLVKIPELNRDMRQFSVELTKVRLLPREGETEDRRG